jgi:transposase-like protein
MANTIIKWDGDLCPVCTEADSKKKKRFPKDYDDYYCSACGARFAGELTPPGIEADTFLHCYEKLDSNYRKSPNQ